MEAILLTILTPIEPLLGWLLSKRKGRDAGLFTHTPVFSTHPTSTLSVSCDLGKSGTTLPLDYASSAVGGADRIPSLSWDVPASIRDRVVEYVLIAEDPDAPLAMPIVHGVYYAIPAATTKVTHRDFALDDPNALEGTDLPARENVRLKGGFCLGQNRRGNVYVSPRPVRWHGPHRYFFSVVALAGKVDGLGMLEIMRSQGKTARLPGIEELGKEIEGRILGWGEWIGVYER